jgi:hypothetical protein
MEDMVERKNGSATGSRAQQDQLRDNAKRPALFLIAIVRILPPANGGAASVRTTFAHRDIHEMSSRNPHCSMLCLTLRLKAPVR